MDTVHFVHLNDDGLRLPPGRRTDLLSGSGIPDDSGMLRGVHHAHARRTADVGPREGDASGRGGFRRAGDEVASPPRWFCGVSGAATRRSGRGNGHPVTVFAEGGEKWNELLAALDLTVTFPAYPAER